MSPSAGDAPTKEQQWLMFGGDIIRKRRGVMHRLVTVLALTAMLFTNSSKQAAAIELGFNEIFSDSRITVFVSQVVPMSDNRYVILKVRNNTGAPVKIEQLRFVATFSSGEKQKNMAVYISVAPHGERRGGSFDDLSVTWIKGRNGENVRVQITDVIYQK
jgi:hypothetical protein